MSKVTTFVGLGLAVLAAVAAWGADYAVERVPEAAAKPGPAGYDATKELKWDSGTPGWQVCYYTGAGTWVGNDFDISTISTFRGIKTIRVYSSPAWPNGRWDGFRFGVYAFSGGIPGSLLWGPKYGVGTGSTYTWVEIGVDWTLPAGQDAFVGAAEQFYNYPGNDPFCIDSNATFLGHSWQYYGGKWEPYDNEYTRPYRNLMIRVVVDDTLAVTPASLGRVKALYF
jgi:hypothetical protein